MPSIFSISQIESVSSRKAVSKLLALTRSFRMILTCKR